MAHFDLSLPELQTYKPDLPEPVDFDVFWHDTLAQAEQAAWAPCFEPLDLPLTVFQVFDVTFAGFDGQPVKAWLILPRHGDRPRPCVVEFVAYGGGRGHPLDWLHWPAAGFAAFIMDTRGQGGEWLSGDTPDLAAQGHAPHTPGFLTLGLHAPQTHYYRRLITDAVRAVIAARVHPGIDPARVAVGGFSQGAGVALAVAGLDDRVVALLAEMPFLCDVPRAAVLTDDPPYAELGVWLRLHPDREQQAFDTLAYFDGVAFARRTAAPAMFAAGLMDTTCPPSTVFAAYHHYRGPKSMRVFAWHQHQSGGAAYRVEQIAFLNHCFEVNR
ncbi:MAG: acetylxylan esterase [Anaerolineae bacterium]|nr:acetylxylan esterase [Anaerolineae bacterium]